MIEVNAVRAGKLANQLGNTDAAVTLLRQEIAENGQTGRAVAAAGEELSRLRGECDALRERVRAQDGTIQGLLAVLGTAAQRLGASDEEAQARVAKGVEDAAAIRQMWEDCAAVCSRCAVGAISEAKLDMHGARVWVHPGDPGDIGCAAYNIHEARATKNGDPFPTARENPKPAEDVPF